jgi:predicted O-methyltransferase YrrM
MITLTGELNTVLTQLAGQMGLDAAALIQYAAEDPHSRMGWDNDKGEAPVGSLFSNEGRILYALVRLLKPALVLELGTCVGASTTHLAAALHDNEAGKLVTVDSKAQLGSWTVGQLVPNIYRQRIAFITGDGVAYMRDAKAPDFIFEDLMHSTPQVSEIARLAVDKLTPGGLLVSHDAGHFIVGHEVRDGFAAAGLEPIIVMPEPSDCGLAIWRKPGQMPAAKPEPVQPVVKEPEPEWPTTPKPSSAASGAKKRGGKGL